MISDVWEKLWCNSFTEWDKFNDDDYTMKIEGNVHLEDLIEEEENVKFRNQCPVTEFILF